MLNIIRKKPKVNDVQQSTAVNDDPQQAPARNGAKISGIAAINSNTNVTRLSKVNQKTGEQFITPPDMAMQAHQGGAHITMPMKNNQNP